MIDSLDDPRQPGKIAFTFNELIRRRTYSIAFGYEDGIGANTLAVDPVHGEQQLSLFNGFY